MADKNDKVAGAIPGKYYVDRSCVPCNLCIDEAPSVMALSPDEDHALFTKQPSNAEEEAQAQAAMAICPSEAIGDDG